MVLPLSGMEAYQQLYGAVQPILALNNTELGLTFLVESPGLSFHLLAKIRGKRFEELLP